MALPVTGDSASPSEIGFGSVGKSEGEETEELTWVPGEI
jgi:hypothetical protein